jgi:uncharacterized protein YcaQ
VNTNHTYKVWEIQIFDDKRKNINNLFTKAKVVRQVRRGFVRVRDKADRTMAF